MGLTEGERAPFRWRDELRWLALPMLVGLAMRVAAGLQLERFMDSDTGVLGLAARDIWRGERFPLFFYGNDYMAVWSAYVAAPLHAVLGAQAIPAALGLAQALIFALVTVPVCYRLFHMVGGRAGALVATLALAVGTPAQLQLTAGQMSGYLGLLTLGALLYAVALPRLRTCGPGGAALIGAVAGLGYVTNPQITSFVPALALAWWLAGSRAARLLAGEVDGLREPDAVRGRARRLLSTGVVVALGCVAAVVYGAAYPAASELSLGPLHLTLDKSFIYLERAIGATALVVLWLEWRLSPARGALLARAAAGVAGGLIGLAPLIAFKVAVAAEAIDPPIMKPLWKLQPKLVPDNAPDVARRVAEALFGAPGALWPLALALVTAAAVMLAWAGGGVLWRLLTLRSAERDDAALVAPVALASQLIVLPLLIACYPLPKEPRYFLALWVPMGVVVAWAAGRLAGRARWVYGAALLVALAAVSIPWLTAVPRGVSRGRRDVLDELARRGVSHGYAEYFDTYDLLYLSRARATGAAASAGTGELAMCVFRHNRAAGNRLPWVSERLLAEKPTRMFVLFNTARRDEVDLERRFLRRFADAVEGEPSDHGVYRLYVFRRDPKHAGHHVDF